MGINFLKLIKSQLVAIFLEHDQLLGLTGVKDKLQEDVKSTLEWDSDYSFKFYCDFHQVGSEESIHIV